MFLTDEKDYIMRRIKEMAQALFSVAIGKNMFLSNLRRKINIRCRVRI